MCGDSLAQLAARQSLNHVQDEISEGRELDPHTGQTFLMLLDDFKHHLELIQIILTPPNIIFLMCGASLAQ